MNKRINIIKHKKTRNAQMQMENLVKFFVNIVELIIIVKITYVVLRYFVKRMFRKKSKRSHFSAFSKVKYMISKQIHSKLNSMIKQQKENLAVKDSPNVIDFKKYKRKVVN
jgi:hypothetical protein